MHVGDHLGPYRILRELGSGGMGTVYAAVAEGTSTSSAAGTVVALKVVHPHLLEAGGFAERFRREGQIGRRVDHPNVVRTIAHGESDRAQFLVMEYVEGQTLRALLAELERLPEELCRHVAREVCRGLVAIHAAGAIHRDMKPDNVLVTAEHVVKVMDLGVARLAEESLRLSRTGEFAGSVQYAAPEALVGGGREADARADLHALGLVLYELATGENPYDAEALPDVIQRVLRATPRRLGEVNPQVTPFYEEVVHCLLAKSPDERFGSATELLAVLEQGEASDWWRARCSTIRATTRRPLRRVRIPRETEVFGREAELAALGDLVASARDGAGRVVLIHGEAGIGKSRLVDELVGRLQADGEDLAFLSGSYPPGGVATASGGFLGAFREQLGPSGSGPLLRTTPALVPAFDALLRGDPLPAGCEQLTKEALHTCFVNATAALAAERTTLILIDDLHFAPAQGRALFTALAMAIADHRVLLIGTLRPGVPEEWTAGVTRFEHTTQLELGRLGAKDLAQLLAASFRSEQLATRLGHEIALKSDGNPFFAFEIIRGLREDQFITRREDGAWVSTQSLGEIQIPASVLDLVNARVADLSEDERDLLDVASCCGFEFDPALVGEVLGIARIPLLKRFGQIERTHRLVRAAGRRMVFDHHQVQEALYESLLVQLREEYHAALADALEARSGGAQADPEARDGALCVELCDHLLKSAAPERALRYLSRAQDHLQRHHLAAATVELTDRALAVPGLLTGGDRAHALLVVAGACDVTGDRVRQEAAAQEAEQLAHAAGDAALEARAANALGTVYWRTARVEDCRAASRRALAVARAHGDRTAEANAIANLGAALNSMGRVAEAREQYERQLALSREVGDERGEATALGNLGGTYGSEGRMDESRRYFEQYLARTRALGDRTGESLATANLGLVLESLGRLHEAREHFERSLELSRTLGDRQGEAVATGSLGIADCTIGRLDASLAHHERGLALCRETGYRVGEVIALHDLANVLGELGRFEEARTRLLQSIALAEELGDALGAAASRFALGSLLALRFDESGSPSAAEQAREALDTARRTAADIGLAGVETLARCALAGLPGGDGADARAAFESLGDRLTRGELLQARYLLWRVTGDAAHLAAAKELLDVAVAQFPQEVHASMRANVRLHRAVLAAWERSS